jgi:hypothetical protein
MIKLLGGFCVALALILGAGRAAGADVAARHAAPVVETD